MALYRSTTPTERPHAAAEQLIAALRTCPIPELARLGRTLHAWRDRAARALRPPRRVATARPRTST